MTAHLKNPTAADMGRKGGQSTSEKKRAASRKNGILGAHQRKVQKAIDKAKRLGVASSHD